LATALAINIRMRSARLWLLRQPRSKPARSNYWSHRPRQRPRARWCDSIHLSRRTTRDVQHLFIISDPTQRGLVAAQRIADMRRELSVNIENAYLVVNRVNGELAAPLKAQIEKMDVPLLGVIPANDDLASFEFSGKPLVELGDDSPVYRSVESLMRQILE